VFIHVYLSGMQVRIPGMGDDGIRAHAYFLWQEWWSLSFWIGGTPPPVIHYEKPEYLQKKSSMEGHLSEMPKVWNIIFNAVLRSTGFVIFFREFHDENAALAHFASGLYPASEEFCSFLCQGKAKPHTPVFS